MNGSFGCRLPGLWEGDPAAPEKASAPRFNPSPSRNASVRRTPPAPEPGSGFSLPALQTSWSFESGLRDEGGDDLLAAGLVEIHRQLVALGEGDAAIAELVMEDAGAGGEAGGA